MSLIAALLLASLQGPVVVLAASGAETEPGYEWVGEAVGQLLPRALARRGVPVVSPEDRLEAHLRLGVPARDPSRATALRVGEALGAREVVVGEYRVTSGGIELSARVLDLPGGRLRTNTRVWGVDSALGVSLDQLATALAGSAAPDSIPGEALDAFARSFGAARAAQRELLERAVSAAPDLAEARLALGRLLFEVGEQPRALEVWSGVGPGPLYRRARFLAAASLLEAGESAAAAEAFEALAAELPTPAALNNLGIARLRAGMDDAAARAGSALERAAALAPGAPAIRFNHAWARLVWGDAAGAASELAQGDPRDLPARLARCWALRLAGDPAWEPEWVALQALEPGFEGFAEPDLERRLERVLPSEHPLALEDGIRSDVELAAAHVGRAETLLAGGATEAAVAELTRAVYLDPHGARGHLLLGRAHRARGDAAAALQELRMSLWCRDDASVRVELAELLLELGMDEEARREAERVLEGDPDNERALRLAAPGADP